jgi:hypothetical protein
MDCWLGKLPPDFVEELTTLNPRTSRAFCAIGIKQCFFFIVEAQKPISQITLTSILFSLISERKRLAPVLMGLGTLLRSMDRLCCMPQQFRKVTREK